MITISLAPDFFRPAKEGTSDEPMQIPVGPPPPETFSTSHKLGMLRIFHKASTPAMRYPGKVEKFDPMRLASQSAVSTKLSWYTIPRNGAGQRVDPAVWASQELVETVKRKRVCKDHHLHGRCRRRACEFQHGFLEKQELYALRDYARQWPCRNESMCLDARCYWGHMCLRSPKCDQVRCRFRQMHVVDFQVNHYAHQL